MEGPHRYAWKVSVLQAEVEVEVEVMFQKLIDAAYVIHSINAAYVRVGNAIEVASV